MASRLHVSSPSCLLPTCCVREPLALKSLLQNGHNQRLLVFCLCPCGCRARLRQQQQRPGVRGPAHYQPMLLLPLSHLLAMLLPALAAHLSPVGQPLNQIASFYILCKAEDQLEII